MAERSDGVRIGELVAIQDNFVPLVVFPGQPGTAAIRARTIPSLSAKDIGKAVVLSFADGSLDQPIIMGCLVDDRARPIGTEIRQVEIDADGRSLVVSAKDEIMLRCGKASLTLTRAGKVLIRGTHVVSRSSGANLVKGGIVEIN
ncbi:hypothetical protein CI15_29940 [Paraburkholderia monticola]|uniref:DUF6484 domain-containing protein n=1 Tax=Paraburkholderia monticola TaxID=1399968 RepID=A0A149PEL8_9BURK|nr:hypothetical protein CI15_29940 [Paraburkholderia monticola]